MQTDKILERLSWDEIALNEDVLPRPERAHDDVRRVSNRGKRKHKPPRGRSPEPGWKAFSRHAPPLTSLPLRDLYQLY